MWASASHYGEQDARRRVEHVLRALQADYGHVLAEGSIRVEGEHVVARTVCVGHRDLP